MMRSSGRFVQGSFYWWQYKTYFLITFVFKTYFFFFKLFSASNCDFSIYLELHYWLHLKTDQGICEDFETGEVVQHDCCIKKRVLEEVWGCSEGLAKSVNWIKYNLRSSALSSSVGRSGSWVGKFKGIHLLPLSPFSSCVVHKLP